MSEWRPLNPPDALAASVWSWETRLEAKEILSELLFSFFAFLAVLKRQMFMVCPVAASKPPAWLCAVAVFYQCPWKYCRWLQKCLLLPSLCLFKTTRIIFQPRQSVPLIEHRRASSNTGGHGGNVLPDTKRKSFSRPKSPQLAWDSLLILGEIHSALANVASPFPVLLPALTTNPFLSTLEGQSYLPEILQTIRVSTQWARGSPFLRQSAELGSYSQENLEEASLSPELQLAR